MGEEENLLLLEPGCMLRVAFRTVREGAVERDASPPPGEGETECEGEPLKVQGVAVAEALTVLEGRAGEGVRVDAFQGVLGEAREEREREERFPVGVRAGEDVKEIIGEREREGLWETLEVPRFLEGDPRGEREEERERTALREAMEREELGVAEEERETDTETVVVMEGFREKLCVGD